jgi:hypothetical protein
MGEAEGKERGATNYFVIDKLLALIEIATRKREGLEEELVDPYVFLLEKQYNVLFGYPFTFAPLPYSGELWQTLFGLEYSGYLSASTFIISDKGRKRVEQQTALREFHEIYDVIETAYDEFSEFDKEQLYDAIYAKIA